MKTQLSILFSNPMSVNYHDPFASLILLGPVIKYAHDPFPVHSPIHWKSKLKSCSDALLVIRTRGAYVRSTIWIFLLRPETHSLWTPDPSLHSNPVPPLDLARPIFSLNQARAQGLNQFCTLLRETCPFSWPTCQQIWRDRIEEREKDFCISSPHALFMSVCKVSFAKSPAHRRFQKRGELAFKEGSWPFVMRGCCEP